MISFHRILLCTAFSVAGSLAAAQELRLLDFELTDQFGNVHRRSDVEGSIVLLIGSDKGGSKFNGAWGEAIHESLGDGSQFGQISQLAYADLRGLPFFLKRFVRGKFPQNRDRWVLMDWKGVIARTYEFAPKSSNVLVFDPDGILVHHASGREPDDASVTEVVAVLLGLLDEAR